MSKKPSAPAARALSLEDLDQVVGGATAAKVQPHDPSQDTAFLASLHGVAAVVSTDAAAVAQGAETAQMAISHVEAAAQAQNISTTAALTGLLGATHGNLAVAQTLTTNLVNGAAETELVALAGSGHLAASDVSHIVSVATGTLAAYSADGQSALGMSQSAAIDVIDAKVDTAAHALPASQQTATVTAFTAAFESQNSAQLTTEQSIVNLAAGGSATAFQNVLNAIGAVPLEAESGSPLEAATIAAAFDGHATSALVSQIEIAANGTTSSGQAPASLSAQALSNLEGTASAAHVSTDMVLAVTESLTQYSGVAQSLVTEMTSRLNSGATEAELTQLGMSGSIATPDIVAAVNAETSAIAAASSNGLTVLGQSQAAATTAIEAKIVTDAQNTVASEQMAVINDQSILMSAQLLALQLHTSTASQTAALAAAQNTLALAVPEANSLIQSVQTYENIGTATQSATPDQALLTLDQSLGGNTTVEAAMAARIANGAAETSLAQEVQAGSITAATAITTLEAEAAKSPTAPVTALAGLEVDLGGNSAVEAAMTGLIKAGANAAPATGAMEAVAKPGTADAMLLSLDQQLGRNATVEAEMTLRLADGAAAADLAAGIKAGTESAQAATQTLESEAKPVGVGAVMALASLEVALGGNTTVEQQIGNMITNGDTAVADVTAAIKAVESVDTAGTVDVTLTKMATNSHNNVTIDAELTARLADGAAAAGQAAAINAGTESVSAAINNLENEVLQALGPRSGAETLAAYTTAELNAEVSAVAGLEGALGGNATVEQTMGQLIEKGASAALAIAGIEANAKVGTVDQSLINLNQAIGGHNATIQAEIVARLTDGAAEADLAAGIKAGLSVSSAAATLESEVDTFAQAEGAQLASSGLTGQAAVQAANAAITAVENQANAQNMSVDDALNNLDAGITGTSAAAVAGHATVEALQTQRVVGMQAMADLASRVAAGSMTQAQAGAILTTEDAHGTFSAAEVSARFSVIQGVTALADAGGNNLAALLLQAIQNPNATVNGVPITTAISQNYACSAYNPVLASEGDSATGVINLGASSLSGTDAANLLYTRMLVCGGSMSDVIAELATLPLASNYATKCNAPLDAMLVGIAPASGYDPALINTMADRLLSGSAEQGVVNAVMAGTLSGPDAVTLIKTEMGMVQANATATTDLLPGAAEAAVIASRFETAAGNALQTAIGNVQAFIGSAYNNSLTLEQNIEVLQSNANNTGNSRLIQSADSVINSYNNAIVFQNAIAIDGTFGNAAAMAGQPFAALIDSAGVSTAAAAIQNAAAIATSGTTVNAFAASEGQQVAAGTLTAQAAMLAVQALTAVEQQSFALGLTDLATASGNTQISNAATQEAQAEAAANAQAAAAAAALESQPEAAAALVAQTAAISSAIGAAAKAIQANASVASAQITSLEATATAGKVSVDAALMELDTQLGGNSAVESVIATRVDSYAKALGASIASGAITAGAALTTIENYAAAGHVSADDALNNLDAGITGTSAGAVAGHAAVEAVQTQRVESMQAMLDLANRVAAGSMTQAAAQTILNTEDAHGTLTQAEIAGRFQIVQSIVAMAAGGNAEGVQLAQELLQVIANPGATNSSTGDSILQELAATYDRVPSDLGFWVKYGQITTAEASSLLYAENVLLGQPMSDFAGQLETLASASGSTTSADALMVQLAPATGYDPALINVMADRLLSGSAEQDVANSVASGALTPSAAIALIKSELKMVQANATAATDILPSTVETNVVAAQFQTAAANAAASALATLQNQLAAAGLTTIAAIAAYQQADPTGWQSISQSFVTPYNNAVAFQTALAADHVLGATAATAGLPIAAIIDELGIPTVSSVIHDGAALVASGVTATSSQTLIADIETKATTAGVSADAALILANVMTGGKSAALTTEMATRLLDGAAEANVAALATSGTITGEYGNTILTEEVATVETSAAGAKAFAQGAGGALTTQAMTQLVEAKYDLALAVLAAQGNTAAATLETTEETNHNADILAGLQTYFQISEALATKTNPALYGTSNALQGGAATAADAAAAASLDITLLAAQGLAQIQSGAITASALVTQLQTTATSNGLSYDQLLVALDTDVRLASGQLTMAEVTEMVFQFVSSSLTQTILESAQNTIESTIQGRVDSGAAAADLYTSVESGAITTATAIQTLYEASTHSQNADLEFYNFARQMPASPLNSLIIPALADRLIMGDTATAIVAAMGTGPGAAQTAFNTIQNMLAFVEGSAATNPNIAILPGNFEAEVVLGQLLNAATAATGGYTDAQNIWYLSVIQSKSPDQIVAAYAAQGINMDTGTISAVLTPSNATALGSVQTATGGTATTDPGTPANFGTTDAAVNALYLTDLITGTYAFAASNGQAMIPFVAALGAPLAATALTDGQALITGTTLTDPNAQANIVIALETAAVKANVPIDAAFALADFAAGGGSDVLNLAMSTRLANGSAETNVARFIANGTISTAEGINILLGEVNVLGAASAGNTVLGFDRTTASELVLAKLDLAAQQIGDTALQSTLETTYTEAIIAGLGAYLGLSGDGSVDMSIFGGASGAADMARAVTALEHILVSPIAQQFEVGGAGANALSSNASVDDAIDVASTDSVSAFNTAFGQANELYSFIKTEEPEDPSSSTSYSLSTDIEGATVTSAGTDGGIKALTADSFGNNIMAVIQAQAGYSASAEVDSTGVSANGAVGASASETFNFGQYASITILAEAIADGAVSVGVNGVSVTASVGVETGVTVDQSISGSVGNGFIGMQDTNLQAELVAGAQGGASLTLSNIGTNFGVKVGDYIGVTETLSVGSGGFQVSAGSTVLAPGSVAANLAVSASVTNDNITIGFGGTLDALLGGIGFNLTFTIPTGPVIQGIEALGNDIAQAFTNVGGDIADYGGDTLSGFESIGNSIKNGLESIGL